MEATKGGFFTPSHLTQIDLTTRSDGQFDTLIDIIFEDPNGKQWTAPAGTITDGASIPSVIASFFGGKLNREHLFAAIVHDAYCAEANTGGPSFQIESWEDTHRMFYHACIANGTNRIKAGTMYAGVRLGGPRWSLDGQNLTTLSRLDPEVIQAEMSYCKDWIEQEGDTLTLDDIDRWMAEREGLLLQSK